MVEGVGVQPVCADSVTCSAPARWVVLVAIVLSVLACSRTDPGISREKAEVILRAYDFTDIQLQPSPAGWSGTAIPASGGYRIQATVDRQGLMQLRP
jgi:hypothetical protein